MSSDKDTKNMDTPVGPVEPSNVEHGERKEWHKNGQLMYQCYYKDWKKHGEYKEWRKGTDTTGNSHDGGQQIWVQCYYKDGKVDGEYKYWHTNGQLYYQAYHKDGKLDGEYKCWYIDGSLDRKSTRLNSSHQISSYAVLCLKKKKTNTLSNDGRRAIYGKPDEVRRGEG